MFGNYDINHKYFGIDWFIGWFLVKTFNNLVTIFFTVLQCRVTSRATPWLMSPSFVGPYSMFGLSRGRVDGSS